MAIRLVVAALVAVPVSRVLLRVGIRQPRLRVVVALIPTVVLTAVLALSWSTPRLPTLGHPGAGVPIRFGNTYVEFAPMAVQLLLAAWALVAVGRITWRLGRRRQVHRRVTQDVLQAALTPLHVALLADRVADHLGIATPPVAIVDSCAGGACVHGIRRPRLLLDARLVERLDHRELEAVLAHEFAHIKRRDNLTSLAVAIVRDVFFFVPGAAWASRRLHTERELAADQVACATTKRPGALASGLLKVLDLQGGAVGAPAAAFMPQMPESTLLGRVRLLVKPQEISATRRRAELGVILTAAFVAAGVGLGAPAMVYGAGVSDLMFFYTPGGTPAVPPTTHISSSATAFDVYRSMPLAPVTVPATSAPVIDDDPSQFRMSMMEACRSSSWSVCSTRGPAPSLGLRAEPLDRLPEPLVEQWRATPIISTDVFHFYLNRRIDDQRTR